MKIQMRRQSCSPSGQNSFITPILLLLCVYLCEFQQQLDVHWKSLLRCVTSEVMFLRADNQIQILCNERLSQWKFNDGAN